MAKPLSGKSIAILCTNRVEAIGTCRTTLGARRSRGSDRLGGARDNRLNPIRHLSRARREVCVGRSAQLGES